MKKKTNHYAGKFAPWMWLAWVLFAVVLVSSLVILNRYGIFDSRLGGYGSRGLSDMQFIITASCIGQTLVSLLIAGGFTIASSIYDAVIEVRSE